MPKPKISIVSVLFNASSNVEATLVSAIEQSYDNIEIIIIDGGSTDDTLQKVNANISHIDHLISEPDHGIYDAMNKGIHLATGDWIYFLNAGDQFYSQHTIKQVFEEIDKGTKLIFGNHESVYPYFKRIHIPQSLEQIWKGMIFSHQGMFVKTSLMKAQPFDITFKQSADYNFIIQLYLNQVKFQYKNITIASLEAGGVSEVNIQQTHIERWKSIRRHSHISKVKIDFQYFTQLVKIYLIKFVKFILPKSWIKRITKRKYNIE